MLIDMSVVVDASGVDVVVDTIVWGTVKVESCVEVMVENIVVV
jgi:hypothetical protein